LPATYFVATESVLSGQPFGHDVKNNCPIPPNTVAEIRDIARAGFEIGGHTQNHVDIGGLTDRAAVEEEILGGIKQLEGWGVGPVQYFSFPFGLPQNTSQMAVEILLKAGLAGFCTAYGAWNWPGSRGYHLRRIHADPGMQTLKSWLTLDARKLHDTHVLPFGEPTLDPRELTAASVQLTAV
jgi:peptidoglycan/xylan/chitin deacetylase (PgdA/CDA1 family)